jgi:flagellar M-ring protein FliF
VIGAGILAVVLIAVFSAAPSMVPLISTPVTDETARLRISNKLDELGIRYQLRSDNVFYVADEKIAQRARGILVEEDLVPKGTDPWALFDMERWTITDFERDVNLQRAIQNQLQQHILALGDVDNVSVTLVIPKKELFTEDQEPTTASVIVTPRPGSDLTEDRKKVEGMQKLIAFAVPGLKTENIVITDQNGVQLNDFTGLAQVDRLELAKRELQVKLRYETDLRARILKSLASIYGSDRVQIPNVSVDLDMSKVSSKAEEFSGIEVRPDNPKTPWDESQWVNTLPRSSQVVTESFQGTGFTPEGPPGQEGQTPPAYKDLSNLVGKYDKSSTTVNNELNKTTTDTEKQPWEIKRITVGVALDGIWRREYDKNGRLVLNPDGSIKRGYVSLTPQDLVQAKNLIQGAIGYNALRGDDVKVENIPFDRSKIFEEEDSVYRRQMALRRTLYVVAAGVGALLIIALLYRLIAREVERRRRLREEELARQHQAMREAALRTAEEQGVEVELSVEDRARMEMQENAANMAREHPEDVAQLIRTWLVEE